MTELFELEVAITVWRWLLVALFWLSISFPFDIC